MVEPRTPGREVGKKSNLTIYVAKTKVTEASS